MLLLYATGLILFKEFVMKKLLPVILIVVLLVAVFFAIKVLKPKRSSDYTSFLPKSTTIVFTLKSPLKTMAKFPFERHKELFQGLAGFFKQRMGIDFTNPKDFSDKGVNIHKPLGIAVLDMEKNTNVFFLAVTNEARFKKYLTTRKTPFLKTYEKKIDGVSCTITGNKSFQKEISCFMSGYWVAYTSANYKVRQNLEKYFTEDILRASSKLREDVVFTKTLEGMDDLGDFFYFMNYQKLMQEAYNGSKKRVAQPQLKMLEMIMSTGKDFSGMGFSGNIVDDKIIFSQFLYMKNDSNLLKAYKGTGSFEALFSRLPKDPILCMANVGNMDYTWDYLKSSLNSIFTLSPFGKQFKNLDEFFKSLQQGIKKQLALDIDFEKDFIQNLTGSSAIALYDLPSSPEKLDINFVFGTKIREPVKMSKLLSDIVKSLMKKNPNIPINSVDIANSTAFSLDLKAMKIKADMEPVLAVYKNYLILVSKKEVLEKITRGSDNLLSTLKNEVVINGVRNGVPSVGQLKFAKFIRQIVTLLPQNYAQFARRFVSITNHFEEVYWDSSLKNNGLYASLVFQADGNVFEQICNEIKKQIPK